MPHGTGKPRFPRKAAESFHKWHYRAADQTWRHNHWRGVPIHKNAFDIWEYAQLIHSLRPHVIVEGGTLEGGSALWFAECCQGNNIGRVLTIDISEPAALPSHPLLQFHQGDMLDPSTIELVRQFIGDDGPVLLVLDDDHRAEHVLAELRTYAPMLKRGDYLIVEDVNLHNLVWRSHGPGPGEALRQWREEDDPPFAEDCYRERHGFTFNSWLVRVM